MVRHPFFAAFAALLFFAQASGAAPAVKGENPGGPDPFLWLANIHGEKALAWAKAQTAKADAQLTSAPGYRKDRAALLDLLNTPDRIPQITLHGGWAFNFWQDKDHVRGLWRRTAIADYANGTPHWQTLLDLDALDKKTGKDWVWKGADCTPKAGRCLVRLSPGGGDAVEIREFDLAKGAFADGGFSLHAAKSTALYRDRNTILFATDFGPGTLTESGYPRIVKLWHRGEPLGAAQIVYEAKPNDVWARPAVYRGPYGVVPLVVRGIGFFTSEYFYIRPDGAALKLPLPQSADVKGVTDGRLIATLRESWTPAGEHQIGQGAIIAFPVLDYMVTGQMPHVAVLYTPDAHSMVDQVSAGRDAVYAAIYQNVTGTIHRFQHQTGHWRQDVLALPRGGSARIMATDDFGPHAFFTFESFLDPPALYAFDGAALKKAMATKPRFEAAKFAVTQRWAISADGTKIPYFLIRPKAARGPVPTILYGYGGFEVALTPWYWNDPVMPLGAGKLWLARGGAMVVANIRGGGEFGPAWHRAALTYHRQRAFDDFEAVAGDLEAHHLATHWSLGILGASNGGLLVSTVMVQKPNLFGAVVCQRPLIDMVRYTQFGAGASWEAEYGDPADPKMRAYIETYSPYQNVKTGVRYPPVLFITETSDDRVTPVFARMMAAKMESQHHRVFFHESPEGGHGPGATHAEQAQMWALSFAFFRRELGLTR